jgi:hypothetical protein
MNSKPRQSEKEFLMSILEDYSHQTYDVFKKVEFDFLGHMIDYKDEDFICAFMCEAFDVHCNTEYGYDILVFIKKKYDMKAVKNIFKSNKGWFINEIFELTREHTYGENPFEGGRIKTLNNIIRLYFSCLFYEYKGRFKKEIEKINEYEENENTFMLK